MTLHGLDRARFARDPCYRTTIANLNLLTYLIDHRDDAKASNFLVSRGPPPPRAFSVDNGEAFSGLRPLRGWLVRSWSRLLVPALPAEAVERLRRMGRAQLARLAVVAQLELRDGRLRPVAPGPPFDAAHGVRRRGELIQLGLTAPEIDGIGKRAAALVAQVDSGRIGQFAGASCLGRR